VTASRRFRLVRNVTLAAGSASMRKVRLVAEGDVGGREGDVAVGRVTSPRGSDPVIRSQGDIEGDVHSDDGESPDTTLRRSTKGAAMLRPSEDALQTPHLDARKGWAKWHISNQQARQPICQPRRTATDIRIVLVTPGGLELPLLESPGQTARLLEVVSEMAADTDGDSRGGPGTRRPETAPSSSDQVLDRVRSSFGEHKRRGWRCA